MPQRPSAAVLLVVSPCVLAAAVVASLAVGPTGISLDALPAVLWAMAGGAVDAEFATERLVLLDLRLPRTLIGLFVGASLALAGAMMQGMFRNPLADPGLIGVSAGAALAAISTIALGDTALAFWPAVFGVHALPVAAFLGGLATTLLLVLVANRSGGLITGPDHRFVLPASALFGGVIVLTADVIARLIVQPAELPIGIVMAAIGAPVFLHLVIRRGI